MAQPIARRPLFLAACAGMFAFGIVLALLGTLFGLPEMRVQLQVNLSQQGDLFFLLYLGVLASTMLAGPLIDRTGNKPVLFVSSLSVSAALVGFSAAGSFAAGAASAVLLGIGGGGLNTSATALVSDLYEEARGPMLNLLGLFYGVGALAIPLLASSLAAVFTIRQLLSGAAALVGLTTLAYALLTFPPAREAVSFSLAGVVQVARYPGVLLLAALLFCQSGNEAAIGGWASSYLGAAGAGARAATGILAGYWAAMMAARLLAARVLRSIGKAQLILASALGSVAGSAILLAAPSLAVMAVGVMLLGFSFAAIFPTTLAIAGDRYSRYAGSVFGLLFSIAILGGMTFPWAIGHVGQAFSIRLGMLLPLVSAAVICVLAWRIRRHDHV